MHPSRGSPAPALSHSTVLLAKPSPSVLLPSHSLAFAFHCSPEFGYTTIVPLFTNGLRFFSAASAKSSGTQLNPNPTTCSAVSKSAAISTSEVPSAMCSASRSVNQRLRLASTRDSFARENIDASINKRLDAAAVEILHGLVRDVIVAADGSLVACGDGDVGAGAVVVEMRFFDQVGTGQEDGSGPEGAGYIGAQVFKIGSQERVLLL
ncbi:hypothetical protein HBI81_227730 [Parastagonospora nodorum]|nr:hypothetical protein HBH61_205860 [Parastagonospora nodorum]KAH4919123.1 hypothetical protein HBI79_204060 [Parastagonospora nodorum]KAH5346336.1 hypothetical protein HBI49_211290 [Parastagonospora nodorum]KAH5803714.1 hypothetical protein HBI94_194510 [Parastagonospora nodorum]KAH5815252.1 hypothetical protein HBI93_204900 [Parastagonospora nodorum]